MKALNQPEGAEMLISARRANNAVAGQQHRATRSEYNSREVMDYASTAIFELDLQGRFIYANMEWCAFSGCEKAAPCHVIHPDDAEAYKECLGSALGLGNSVRFIARKRRHDGAWRKVRDEIRPVIHDGKVISFVGISTDVTDEIEAREAAFKLAAQIQSAFRQRDVLMTEVHHRVKNNLQAILSMIGLHARRLSSQPARRDLDLVARRIRAMATIQQELHDDADVSRIDLVFYIKRVIDALARLHGRPDVAIQIEGDWADVSIGTAASVGAVISELIANCFDHGLKNGPGSVAVVFVRNSDHVVLTLSDSGPGYDAALAREDGIGLMLAERIADHSRLGLERGEGPGMPWSLTVPLQV